MCNCETHFTKIYDAYQPRILRYTGRLVGESEAEDLTQDVFIKVHQSLGSFRGESQLSTWLYRIATNTAMDRLRSPSFHQVALNCSSCDSLEQDEVEVVDRDVWTGEKTPLVESQLVHQEMNECLLGYIKRLPEGYRTVLVLSEYEGLKNSEIAEILGVTLDTVKIRLHRAREILKEELSTHCEPYWIENNEFLPELKRVDRIQRNLN